MKHLTVILIALFFLLAAAVPVHGEPEAPTATCTSTGSTNWSITTTWSCGRLPGTGDDVIIAAGHVITVDLAASARDVTVNGSLTIGITTTARSLTARRDVIIGSGGLIAPGPVTATNTLNLRGNFRNEGLLNGRPTSNRLLNVTFNGTTNQIITGTGVYTFNNLAVNNGTATNIIDAQSVITLAGTTNPLVLTRGIFKLSSNSVITPFTSSRTLSANSGLWIANGTVIPRNLNITLNGLLRVTGGTLNIGTNNNNSLLNGATGRIFIEGGTISVAGPLARSGTASFGTFSMTNGLLNVVSAGSTITTVPGIDISGATSSWTMSGGTLVLRRRTSHTTQDALIAPNTASLSGGTLQIGDSATPANQAVMRLNATVLPSLAVDGTTRGKSAQLVTTSPVVRGDVAISATATITANNLNLALAGNWINDGAFVAGTGTVTFNQLGEQRIGGNTVTAFNNVVVENGSTTSVSASNPPTVVGSFTVNEGGSVQQTQTVNNDTVAFLQLSSDRYRSVDLTTPNNLGDVTVTIETVAPGGCTDDGAASPAYATRCYLIVPTNDNAATVRLWALTSQLSGLSEASLNVYHYDGAAWQALTTNASVGNDGGSYSYAQADTPGFSEFLLGGTSAPTTVTLNALAANSASAAWPLLPLGVALLAGALVIFSRRRTP